MSSGTLYEEGLGKLTAIYRLDTLGKVISPSVYNF